MLFGSSCCEYSAFAQHRCLTLLAHSASKVFKFIMVINLDLTILNLSLNCLITCSSSFVFLAVPKDNNKEGNNPYCSLRFLGKWRNSSCSFKCCSEKSCLFFRETSYNHWLCVHHNLHTVPYEISITDIGSSKHL